MIGGNFLLERLSNGKLALHYGTVLGWYVTIFVLYVLTGWVAVFNTIPIVYFTLFSSALAFVGLLLTGFDLLTCKRLLKVPHIRWLFAFVICMIVSSLLNISYGWIDNAKTIVWQIVLTGIFLPLTLTMDKPELKNMLRRIFWIGFIVVSVAALVSLIQFFLQTSYSFVDNVGKIQRQGFTDGRLFGIFIDPNYGAGLSVFVFLGTLYVLNMSRENQPFKGALWLGLFINFLYIVGSGSRTAQVSLLVAIVILCLFEFRKRKRTLLRRDKAVFVLKSALILVVLVCVIGVIGQGLSSYAAWIHDRQSVESSTQNETTGTFYAQREDATLDNISTGRFTIWQDYILSSRDSLVFGKSPRNALDIIKDTYPDTYIAKRSYEPHNGYVYVYVATGLVGFGTLLGLAILSIRDILGFIRKNRDLSTSTILACTFLVVVCLRTFTGTTTFFTYNLDAVLFYGLLGALLVVNKNISGSVNDCSEKEEVL